jgi:anthranilate phosphoribosyltransferase
LGVFAPELTDRLATVLRGLGSVRAWVVHALDGLDEISTLGPTRVSELRDGEIHTRTIDPRDFGIKYARLSDLQVSSVDEAADAMIQVLAGQKGPRQDIAAINAGAALVVAGRATMLKDGLDMARHVMTSGAAKKTLDLLIRCSQSN